METKLQTLLLALFACPSLVFLHAAFERFFLLSRLKQSPQISLIKNIVLVNFCLVLFATYFFYDESNFFYILMYDLMFFNCFAYSYFHIFNLSETGRRIKILLSIYNKKNSKLYKTDKLIALRIDRLYFMGQIKKNSEGGYIVKRNFLLFCGLLLRFCGNFFLGKNRL